MCRKVNIFNRFYLVCLFVHTRLFFFSLSEWFCFYIII